MWVSYLFLTSGEKVDFTVLFKWGGCGKDWKKEGCRRAKRTDCARKVQNLYKRKNIKRKNIGDIYKRNTK